MKKIAVIIAAALALLLCVCVSSCGDQEKNTYNDGNDIGSENAGNAYKSDGVGTSDAFQTGTVETSVPEEDEVSVYSAAKVGDKYRNFSGELANGGTFKLSDHEGKVILLNFWATWCGPCVGEMPAFPRLVEKYGDDLVLVAVNCGEDPRTVKRFINKNGYDTLNVVFDTDYTISGTYPTDGIPYTVIIGRDGTISEIQLGAYDAETMFNEYSGFIDAALGE